MKSHSLLYIALVGDPVRSMLLCLWKCEAWNARASGEQEWRPALSGRGVPLHGALGPQVVICCFPMPQRWDFIPASRHNQTGLVLSLHLVSTHFPMEINNHALGRDCRGPDSRTRTVNHKACVPPLSPHVSTELSTFKAF